MPKRILTPGELLLYIISSVSNIHRGFGEKTAAFIKSTKPERTVSNYLPMITLFINDITKIRPGEVCLVIDDFQNIETEDNSVWINDFFNELIENIPANLRLIISSRNEPLFKKSRLRSKRNLFILGDKDLLFNFEETALLTDKISGKTPEAELVNKILTATGGWVTGIHLLLQSKLWLTGIENKIPDNLYDYFYEDVFDSLSSIEKWFIMNTVYLESFTPEFADILLKKTNNSAHVIKSLFRKSIFIESEGSFEIQQFKYQKLFHLFALKYSDEHFTSDDKILLLNKIAEIFRSLSRNESAVDYYFKAQSFKQALAVIEEIFSGLAEKMEFFKLNKWLGMFPRDFTSNEPRLIYIKLYLSVAENKFSDEFVQEIDALLASVRNSSGSLYIKTKILKAKYFIQTGRLQHAYSILKDCSDETADRVTGIEIKILLAKSLYRMGFENYDKAMELSLNTLREMEEYGIKKDKIDLYNFIASIYFDRGDIVSSIKYSEQLLVLHWNIFERFKIQTKLVYLYCTIRELEKAYTYYQQTQLLAEEFLSDEISRLFYRCKIMFFNSMGDHSTAIESLNESYRFVSVRNNNELLWAHYLSLAENYYYINDIGAARQMMKLSRHYINENNEYLTIIDKYCSIVYCKEYNDSASYEKTLIDVYCYHTDNKIEGVLNKIQFNLAEYYFENKNYDTCLFYLKESLDKTYRLNDYSFAEKQLVISRKIFDFAIAADVQKSFINEIIRGFAEKLNYSFIKKKFRSKLLNEIISLTDIRLLSFGNMELFLRGKVIPEDKWIRKKSKIILAYLMANEGIVLTKDKAIDMFFPELPVDKAEVALHSTIYNIRTALRIYDIPKVTKKDVSPLRGENRGGLDYNPQYIIYEDKMLRLNKDFYYSSDNTEFENLYHKIKLPAIDNDEKIKLGSQAAELYKGEFLPGNYESWCEEKRIAYKNMFTDLCEELIALLENGKKYNEAVKYAARLIAEDNINEKGHLCLITSYAAMGNINMARERFRLMLKVFDDELGEKPSDETLEKISDILS